MKSVVFLTHSEMNTCQIQFVLLAPAQRSYEKQVGLNVQPLPQRDPNDSVWLGPLQSRMGGVERVGLNKTGLHNDVQEQ